MEKLKQREVVRIDISNDPIASSDYKADEDPARFKSKKTNRGPLVGNWIEKVRKSFKILKFVPAHPKLSGPSIVTQGPLISTENDAFRRRALINSPAKAINDRVECNIVALYIRKNQTSPI